MDGAEEALRHSLQFRLSAWLAATIVATAVAAGIFSFSAAFDEAHELQDDLLRQIASLMGRTQITTGHLDAAQAEDADEELQITVQDLSGALSDRTLPIPSTVKDGVQTVEISGEPFRVFVKTAKSGRRFAVAQETEARNIIARDSALRSVTPLLFLLPLLLALVAYVVRTMLRPIHNLSDELHRRSEQDLTPIPTAKIPDEMRPFIVAINGLLDRVKRSVDAQRSFVANAAHELRSPMTALSLQAERMKDTEMSETARTRLLELQHGIERGRSLLNQLLALARVQLASPGPKTLISIDQLYREVLEDLMPLAERKNIDIGIETTGGLEVHTSKSDLASVVRNLVDNAIRYTPAGGRVDLAAARRSDLIVLSIKDTGPGIPESERAHVFEPFYRVLGSEEIGSGLGLSIVKTISDRLGFEIAVTYSDENQATGLTATVTIPAR